MIRYIYTHVHSFSDKGIRAWIQMMESVTLHSNPVTELHYLLPRNPIPEKALEKMVKKEENARTQHILLFPQYYLPFQKQFSMMKSLLFSCQQMFLI